MKLFVEFEKNVVFDVMEQKMIDPAVKPGRGARVIPFMEHISIRRLKPRAKLCHRLGDQWISSRRLSFAYLMAYFMVKNKKTVLAGFFNRGYGKYIFMEIKIGNMAIEARHMLSIDSNPASFMAMAGRQYDGIFGDVSLSIEPDYITIPYDKLLSEATKGFSVVKAAAVLAFFVLVTGGVLHYTGLLPAQSARFRGKATVQKQPAAPLSMKEVRALSLLVTREALVKYKVYVDTLPEDIALKSATFRILPVGLPSKEKQGNQQLKGILSFQFESFYPFRGSRRNGEWFVFDESITFTRDRRDVRVALLLESELRGNTKGFETLVELSRVSSRTEKEWKFALSESDYRNVVRVFNDIYLSPVVMHELNITDEKTVGHFTYHEL